MADHLLEFLRRYAKTLTIRSANINYVASPPILDIPMALASLANNLYTYVGVQAIPLTEQSFSYSSLGLNFVNDALKLTDNLLFSEQAPQLYSQQGARLETLAWALADSTGSKVFIPIRDDYYWLIKQYLPHMKWWAEGKYGESYPKQEYYLKGDFKAWPEVYELVIDEIAHPYGKGLYLTGYVIIQADGVPNYEYVDLDGYYGEPGLFYISSLRPPGIDYPLGRPNGGDLVKDLCIGKLDWYPSFGNEYWVGKYTGYRTTPAYHPLVTYYLYERGDGSVFLWEGQPHEDAWLWVRNALGWDGLVIGLGLGNDYIYQQEFSCGVTLLLEDASLIPITYDYPFPQDAIGDCANLDDIFILKGGRRLYRYVDDLFPVADLMAFTDMP